MKKRILIIGGGYSKERYISLKSARAIFKSIKSLYNVKFSDPSNNFFKTIEKFKPDVIFNALHGRFGEDGYIQSIFETLGIKYTHSGVISSMIAMDKVISKKIFVKNKILTPKYLVIKNNLKNVNYNRIKRFLKYPVVVKPINEGSSLDVFICNNKLSLSNNLKKMKHYREILIEKFIPGREIQVAIMSNKVLGSIELKPKRKFYDYKAKYSKSAMTNHIMPANISKKKYEEVLKIAERTHKILGCRGVTRSDFKFINGKFYLLEINTQPGMTDLSLVPEIASYKKISFDKLVFKLIMDASINK